MNTPLTTASTRRTLLGAAALALCSLLGLATASFGALVTVDSAAFAPGTNISNATAGVVLSAPGNPNGTSIFVKQRLPIGGNAFANSAGGVNLSENFTLARPLRADFTSAILSATVTIDQGGGGGGTATLFAFNAANTLIDTQTLTGGGTLTSSVAGINYVLALINTLSLGFDVAPSIKVLQFNTAPVALAVAVPEPGSALAGMLALGACLSGIVRRNRQGAVRA